MPNKLTRFWQELKRRKVVHVITVYAGVAFVIIELINNITEPLRLPEWTPTLVIVLLAIGFPVAVIFSWIYDIHPEGGMVKTEPIDKVKEQEKPKSSSGWKIASYISLVVIIALILLNILPRTGRNKVSEVLDKSIAVLPFINDSPEEENTYFINGIMEELLLNLQAIEDFQVPGRTSVEQYRTKTKSIPEIAEELGVNYIIEGSGQKYGSSVRLHIQLLEGKKGMHLWGESYDEHIENPEDMLNIQSRIAHSIAEQLKAVITPNVRQRLEKIPTNSLTAYDFYWRGRNEHIKYRLDHSNREALEEAEDQYYKALDYDSTFARAYAGLAQVYWDKHYWETYLSVNFMDSVLIYTDMALHYDNQLSDAYSIRGAYNQEIGNNEEALAEFEKAIDYNPNNWEVYWRKGNLYFGIDLLVEAIKNYHKAASLNPGPELPDILIQLGRTYFNAGFFEEGTKYIQNVLILDGDSVAYYNNLSSFAFWSTNYEEAVNLLEKAYALDTSYYYTLLRLGMNYTFNGQYDKALKYFKKYVDRIEELGDIAIIHMHRIGYAYWQNGYKEEAEYYINEQINYCNRMNELGRSLTQQLITYYNLAAAYAFKGERERAYENLNIFIQRDHMAYWAVFWIKNDPLLNSIREEPEFRQIVRDVEAKYQAEHERVRQWLEDNEML